MKNRSILMFIFIAIACLVIGVGGVILMRTIVPGLGGLNHEDDSKMRCEDVVKASLRDSVKAKFRNQKSIVLDDNRYQNTGLVDAPNATGIIVRGNYNCIFNYNTRTFDLLSLEGDDIWKPLKK
jgi:hypothetical protein